MGRKMKHGDAVRGHRAREYNLWVGMRFRCNNKKCSIYKHYGGKGIRVCARWNNKEDGYQNFLADMGRAPTAKHSIDRKDSLGDYGPQNCRWATAREQARNTATNRALTYCGKTMCIADWADEMKIPAQRISCRLHRGLSVKEALFSGTKARRYEMSPGDRFGRWRVLSETSRGKSGTRRYLCACDCGTRMAIAASTLGGGKTGMCRACSNKKNGMRRRAERLMRDGIVKALRKYPNMLPPDRGDQAWARW